MKIRKDPYCMDFHLGFTLHFTHCWVTPHNFSVNGVTDKAPIPDNSSTFCKYCCRTWTFFVRKHPIGYSTHILCHFDFYTHITHTLTNFTPILCPHDSTQVFHFCPPIPHQILFEHATPHFCWAAPRGLTVFDISLSEESREINDNWAWQVLKTNITRVSSRAHMEHKYCLIDIKSIHVELTRVCSLFHVPALMLLIGAHTFIWKNVQIAIQFLGRYVIVMSVGNYYGDEASPWPASC